MAAGNVMYLDLIHNVALLVALSSLYSLLTRQRSRGEVCVKISMGLLFGGVAVIGMLIPFHYTTGIVYDGRSIVLSMAGLFGGGTAAIISSVITGVYRASLGGPGIWAGLATIIGSALTGLLFRRITGNRPDRIGMIQMFGIGISVHLVMLASQLLIIPWPAGVSVIRHIGLPVLLVYPLATVLLGLLLGVEERRRRAEQELVKSRDLLTRSQQVGRIGSWEMDLLESRLMWSEETYRIFGVDPNEFYPSYEAFLECVHPEDRSNMEVAWTESLEQRTDGYEIEHRIVRPSDGEVRVVLEKCEHIKDKTGRITRSIGFVQDITERKQAEAALRESEEKYQDLYENAPDMFVSVEASTAKIIQCNKTLTEATGYAKEEIIGKPIFDMYHPDCMDDVKETFKLFVNTGEIHDHELQLKRKDGSKIYVSLNVTAVRDEKGNILFSRSVLRDITERKQAEEALKTKLEEVERYNKTMVGRELKMIELKKEVNQLCRKLKIPEKYKIPVSSKGKK